jgi:hypothetical protein
MKRFQSNEESVVTSVLNEVLIIDQVVEANPD